MNVIKEHNTAKKQKGNVCYGSAHGGKWTFRASDKESGSIEKIMKVPGGLKVAEKIAKVISDSWKRTADKKMEASDRIDGRARRQIDHLVKLKTIKDWTGEPEWWSNSSNEALAVPQVFPYQDRKPAGISAEDLAQDAALEQVEAQNELAEALA